MNLFELWTLIQKMPANEFEKLRQLARTEAFSVIASGISNENCLCKVVRELRKLRLEGFPQRGDAKSETRLVVQAITSRIISEPRL